jgi:hypothetical protein
MMGRRERGQGQFFYAFDLDKVVPPDHLVRQIAARHFQFELARSAPVREDRQLFRDYFFASE